MRKSLSEDCWAPLGIPRPVSDKDDLVSDGPTTVYSLEQGEGSLPSLLPVWCPVLENASHLLVVDESHPAQKGAAAGTPAPTPFPLLVLSALIIYHTSGTSHHPSVGVDLAFMARALASQNSKMP